MNVITQLVMIIVFSVCIHLFSLFYLTLLGFVFVALAVFFDNAHFFRLIKSLKWLLLAMFLIFFFNTPGEHIVGWPFDWLHPTYEGFEKACMQVLRVVLMLAALAALLAENTREMLISGFYFLVKPLRGLGFNSERFAARLLLTLHYVDTQAVHLHAKTFKQKITSGFDALLAETDDDDVTITLVKPEWGPADFLTLLLCAAFTVIFLLRGL